jgi:hypothetical protein
MSFCGGQYGVDVDHKNNIELDLAIFITSKFNKGTFSSVLYHYRLQQTRPWHKTSVSANKVVLFFSVN